MEVNCIDNINFTARCKQIKEAQNVCHKVVVNFPHLSSTKLAPLSDKFENRYPLLYDKFISANPAGGRFAIGKTNEERMVFAVFKSIRRLICNINSCRLDRIGIEDDFSKIYAILSQLKYNKIGNCAEDAQISELILRLGGKKNVYTASLNIGDHKVDHLICFFNKDGSKFDGKIGKNTILVDSWLGDADFADNMLLKYKSIYKDFLFMPKNGKISFRNIKSLNLSDKELQSLKQDFPELS